MEFELSVTGAGSAAELRRLVQRLRLEDGLRGRVGLQREAPRPGEMGGVVEVATVAFASGGAGTVLVKVLADWLSPRRSHLVLKVSNARGEVFELDVDNVKDPEALTERFAAFVAGSAADGAAVATLSSGEGSAPDDGAA
ncbi:hypothetical protein GCM10009759_54730 [Kitasatospora saccharophila]|uniref:Uncharacterized protein n=1 Tax=Kitasatospora saccharophila TaxID=407973 RepID=A0ABN2XJR1_9ACTN